MNSKKDTLLAGLRAEIAAIQGKIDASAEYFKELTTKGVEKIAELKLEDQMMLIGMKADAERRLVELEQLHGAPFFVRCDLVYGKSNGGKVNSAATEDDKPGEKKSGEIKTLYFAKYQFSEESIYSWIAPISTIRFETPGPISYKLPDGTVEKAELVRKEQYMIVDGKVLFFATEAVGEPRDLIYQEHFSSRKNGFVLPEIVAVMEKAQDQVIRAHHVGPFVISGPAGSGKTTLALHRVGYLVQAPDTAPHYPSKSIIVFVQDTGTKEYFSHLLPELGIKDVKITTFSEWTMEVLGMGAGETGGAHFVIRPGETEEEKDLLEYEKLQALRVGKSGGGEGSGENSAEKLPKYTTDHFALLEKAYKNHLSKKSAKIFKAQEKSQVFDRIDLTLLLTSFFESHDQLEIVEEYYKPNKKGKGSDLRKFTRRIPVEFSLIVVDEFQNYMPEQLAIFKRTLNEKSHSIIYVGDMAQQVQLGTIREWSHVGENISAERKVMLEKVYRNTKQILRYIGTLGYQVTIPDGLKDGPEVVEKKCAQLHEETAYIEKIIRARAKERESTTFGILTKNSEQQADLRRMFAGMTNIHISTIAEAQGVEFDVVILAGIHERIFYLSDALPAPLLADKKRIEKDLLYVGLTRAINELHVVGSEGLAEVVKETELV